MTPNLNLRSFTNDQYQLDKAFYTNAYKLKGHKGENGPVVVDLGAHAGYFTFAAISLGAKKVYAFEPFPENYRLLLENTKAADFGKVIPYQIGVYTENAVINVSYPMVLEGTYYDFANLKIEEENVPHFKAPCFTLDYILKNLVSESVDILKLNIGYAEIDILLSSSLLPTTVKNIVIETTEAVERLQEFIEKMKEKGYKESALSAINEDEQKFILILAQDKIEDRFNLQLEN